jgi:hypothetical protein
MKIPLIKCIINFKKLNNKKIKLIQKFKITLSNKKMKIHRILTIIIKLEK